MIPHLDKCPYLETHKPKTYLQKVKESYSLDEMMFRFLTWLDKKSSKRRNKNNEKIN